MALCQTMSACYCLQKVEEESIEAWLNKLTSFPRSAQLLKKDGAVVSSLEQAMSRYLKDVTLHTFKADKR